MSVDAMPRLPRLKPIFDVLYLRGRVRLGSGPAFANEIEDPDGSFAELVRLLDGEHTVEQLQAELVAVLDGDEVLAALAELNGAGFLEDSAVAPPAVLSEDDLERYAPNLNFFRTRVGPGQSCYEPQAELKRTTVVLLGLGGIGSNVCMALAELGVGRIVAVDFDRVQLSNLNRQVLYSTDVVGQLKAEAAAERMRQFNPDVTFEVSDRRIGSAADVAEVLDEAGPDFVYCLADKPNGYIDFWVNQACVERGIPFAAASVSAHLGSAYSVLPGQGPCYQCRVDSEIAASPELREPLDYIRSNEVNASNAALGPACMFLAYFLAYELLRHRLDLMGPMLVSEQLLEIDFVTFRQSWHEFQRRPDCPVCASVGAVAV